MKLMFIRKNKHRDFKKALKKRLNITRKWPIVCFTECKSLQKLLTNWACYSDMSAGFSIKFEVGSSSE